MSYIYVINPTSMTSPKYQLFDNELQANASYFKTLSHPALLAILNYLAKSKVCMTGDISRELPLSRTTVNQHLTELNERFKKFISNLDCCDAAAY